jgi:hypothetical protein
MLCQIAEARRTLDLQSDAGQKTVCLPKASFIFGKAQSQKRTQGLVQTLVSCDGSANVKRAFIKKCTVTVYLFPTSHTLNKG